MPLFFTFHCKIETGIYSANSETYVPKIRQTQQKQSNGTCELQIITSRQDSNPTGFIFLTKVKAHISRSSDLMIKEQKEKNNKNKQTKKPRQIQSQETWVRGLFQQFISCLTSGHYLTSPKLSLHFYHKRGAVPCPSPGYCQNQMR